MKEVEIKARLREKEKITNNLKKLGCIFEESCTQEDIVYVRNVGSLTDYLSNDVFLRIRVKNDNKVFFTDFYLLEFCKLLVDQSGFQLCIFRKF